MLIAERDLLGYPGASVELHIDADNIRVAVIDKSGTIEWYPRNRREAKDMFFHPFVFGYEYAEVES